MFIYSFNKQVTKICVTVCFYFLLWSSFFSIQQHDRSLSNVQLLEFKTIVIRIFTVCDPCTRMTKNTNCTVTFQMLYNQMVYWQIARTTNFVQDTHYLQKLCYCIVLMLIILYYKLYAKRKVFKSVITHSSLYLMNICEIETFLLQCLLTIYTSIHIHQYTHIFYTFTYLYHRYFI